MAIPLLMVSALAAPASAQITDTAYTIESGTYAGAVIQVHRATAVRKGSKFWRIAPRTDGRLVGWNPASLPAQVAFRPGQGVTADDSSSFWSILRAMEQDLGMHLFEPTTVSAGEDPDEVILVGVRPMAGDDGVTYLTWSNNGAVYDARVFFRSRGTLHDAAVVQHEMMHTLGFGHTSAWPSLMNANADGHRLSAEDVAYAQVAIKSRGDAEQIDMWDRIALAVERRASDAVAVQRSGTCAPVPPSPMGRGEVLPVKEPAEMTLVGVVVACTSDKSKLTADSVSSTTVQGKR
jgi:hypothetical protein